MKTRFILICQVGDSVTSPLVHPDPGDLDRWMDEALVEARAALAHGDVPVGALVVHVTTGEVIARAHNARERDHDPTAHAEMLALRDAAAAIRRWRLDEHALVVTMEPCPMCAGAAWAARLPLIVFGAADERAGAGGSLYNFAADPRLNHTARVLAGVRGDESASLLRAFFEARRS
jgi:tRNA(adenine34) deaminase